MGKRLTSDEVRQMKDLVVKGVAPEDIARQFDVAISSVHNYKKKFKEEGIQFPSVKGKRPTGSISAPSTLPKTSTEPKSAIRSGNSNPQAGGMQFIINGTTVNITGQATNVTIGKDSMEIKF